MLYFVDAPQTHSPPRFDKSRQPNQTTTQSRGKFQTKRMRREWNDFGRCWRASMCAHTMPRHREHHGEGYLWVHGARRRSSGPDRQHASRRRARHVGDDQGHAVQPTFSAMLKSSPSAGWRAPSSESSTTANCNFWRLDGRALLSTHEGQLATGDCFYLAKVHTHALCVV